MLPDEQVPCHCGRGTYLVAGPDSLRTCSKCGYLTSYCRCKKLGPASALNNVKMPSMTDRTRAIVGTAVVSSIGTLFFVTLFSSPFFAVFGLGIPFGLNAAFFGKWLRDQKPAIASGGLLTVAPVQKTHLMQP